MPLPSIEGETTVLYSDADATITSSGSALILPARSGIVLDVSP